MNKYSHNSFGPVWFVIVYWITCFTFWWFLIIISRIFFMNDYSHNPFGPVWFVIFFWFTFLVFWCFLMIITIRFIMYESTLTMVIVFWFTFFIYFSLRSIRNSPIDVSAFSKEKSNFMINPSLLDIWSSHIWKRCYQDNKNKIRTFIVLTYWIYLIGA